MFVSITVLAPHFNVSVEVCSDASSIWIKYERNEWRRGGAVKMRTADDGVRTRDLRFTKPLLYQLSYVGGKRAKHCIPRRFTQARCCSR